MLPGRVREGIERVLGTRGNGSRSDGVVGSKSHTADRVDTSATHSVCPHLAAGPRQGGRITESNQEGSKGAFRLSHGGPG